ncbi:hypothetical protein PG985_012198 [Apiospora marii]|uniref:Uncharacterized protein n=1 Tax=Apiospora marii TaxID=335849 RepID=A0ABR1RF36_9PEZI
MKQTWYNSMKDVFGHFLPRGTESIKLKHRFRWQYLTVWCWVFAEDYRVENKFGKLEESEQDFQGRTIICEFRLWPHSCGVTPEDEEASATDRRRRSRGTSAIDAAGYVLGTETSGYSRSAAFLALRRVGSRGP